MSADTIFAVSSGRPPAAIAVIRISGRQAFAAATALAGPLPAPRRAHVRALRDGGGALLDRALVIAFPGPASATGEDLVELHCHGGRAVVAAVEEALASLPGMRAADAGEFTRRALLNGRIDLAEAQGLADLLEAETDAQRRAALDAAEGRISTLVGGWMTRITALAAAVEASLDFADEDDVAGQGDGLAAVRVAMTALAAEISDVLAAPPVERLRDGIRVVIAGPPNAGKSTLFNALCDRAASIVSPTAGTTRDRVEAAVQRGGVAYLLVDTAGMRDGVSDPVEEEGVARAAQAVASADVLIWMADDQPPRDDAVWIYGRADLPGRGTPPLGVSLSISGLHPDTALRVWGVIDGASRPLLARPGDVVLYDEQRSGCRAAAVQLGAPARDPLIVAEQLRFARTALGRIVGEAATEAMLDALFGRFCIGK